MLESSKKLLKRLENVLEENDQSLIRHLNGDFKDDNGEEPLWVSTEKLAEMEKLIEMPDMPEPPRPDIWISDKFVYEAPHEGAPFKECKVGRIERTVHVDNHAEIEL